MAMGAQLLLPCRAPCDDSFSMRRGSCRNQSCPLTRLENALRLRGGETGYARDFIGHWLDWLIFYNAPSWMFTAVYLTFGMLVLSTAWFVPVRWPAFLIQMRNTDTVAKLQADPTSRELRSGLS